MIGLMLVLVGGASGATLDVPVPYATVQDAIDAAAPGDTIRIAAGTYSGEVLVNKDLTLEGTGMNETVLTGGTNAFVLTVDRNVTAYASSLAVSGAGACAGVLVDESGDLTLTDVKVREGHSDSAWGAGIRNLGGSLSITRSIICGNTSENGVPAGLFVTSSGTATVTESVFSSNLSDGSGGSIRVRGSADLVNVVVYGSEAPTAPALLVELGGTASVTNAIVASNTATSGAYALEVDGASLGGSSNLYYANAPDHTEVVLPADILGLDPLFANAGEPCVSSDLQDYGLLSGSPAIGVGDLGGEFDDLGAVEVIDLDGDGFAAGYEDCADDDGDVYPGAPEVPGDGIDQNCDSAEDCYLDADDDGDRSEVVISGSSSLQCDGPNEALESQPLDCDDESPLRGSGIPEVPCDGVDNDCDPATPDMAATCHTAATGDTGFTGTVTETDVDTDVDADMDTDVDADTDADADTQVDTGLHGTTPDASSKDFGVAVDGCGCSAVYTAALPSPFLARRR